MFIQQRDQFETAFSGISAAVFSENSFIWLWEVDADTLYISNFCQKTRKLSGKRRIWQWLDPSDRRFFHDRLGPFLHTSENGDCFDLFHRVRVVSTEPGWVLNRIQVTERASDGRALRVSGAALSLESLSFIKDANDNADRMHHALDAARAGLWDWNAETNAVYFSPRYASMMGYDPENFPHELNSWVSRVHRDDIEETLKLQYGYINSPDLGDVFESTYRFRAANGDYNWIMSRAKVVGRDGQGRAKRIIGLHTIVNELYEAQETLENIVNTDQLTRLGSRLSFDTTLAALTEADYPVSLIYMDMDGLKLVNDSLGHESGDEMLVKAARLVKAVFRNSDLVARIGGDEFVALLPRCTMSVAQRLMRNIRNALRKHNDDPANIPIFLSLGVAGTEEGIHLFDLQAAADMKMIDQKRKRSRGHYSIIRRWIDSGAARQVKSVGTDG